MEKEIAMTNQGFLFGKAMKVGVFCLIMSFTAGYAAYVENISQELTQPDGQKIECFLTGDEFHSRLHDADNYTIIQDPATGYYVYALFSGSGLTASGRIVGRDDPRRSGLVPGKDLAPEEIRRLRGRYPYMANEGAAAPPTGTINNVVVYIRFADQAEFTDSVAYYNRMFNNSTPGASSMYNYFLEASYNTLFTPSHFYPTPPGAFETSFQDSHNRNYFLPYNSASNPEGYQNDTERRTREHGLLRDAVNAVSTQVPPSLIIDGDNDGYVDNICFIIRGDHSAWADLLWPHRWALYTYSVYINGKRVWDYNLQLEMFFKQHSDVGVLCHEMAHSVGYPDLYHYYYGTNLSPCGSWDLMCSSPNPPSHMGAYMKNYYTGWTAAIPQITVSGTYWVKPITSATKNAYWIASPNSSSEYFVVEYRRKIGTFEGVLPGSGLLVYRINGDFAGQGNAQYDGSSIFDEVYIYRPGGTPTTNGTVNSAHFSSDVGRTVINDSTNPSSFLHDGNPGGLRISAVSSAGDSISFYVDLGGAVEETDAGSANALLGLTVEPNPFHRRIDLQVNPGMEQSAKGIELKIFDITGRYVKSFFRPSALCSSPFAFVWNGDDESGRAVAAGIYICRLSSGSRSVVRKLIRLD
jgi:M6 family metalloprotease-like protein